MPLIIPCLLVVTQDVFILQLKVVVEVRDRGHGLQVKEALQLQYPNNLLWGLDLGFTSSTSRITET